jgi:hypothetical protein
VAKRANLYGKKILIMYDCKDSKFHLLAFKYSEIKKNWNQLPFVDGFLLYCGLLTQVDW